VKSYVFRRNRIKDMLARIPEKNYRLTELVQPVKQGELKTPLVLGTKKGSGQKKA
jgi:hypothetical protein